MLPVYWVVFFQYSPPPKIGTCCVCLLFLYVKCSSILVCSISSIAEVTEQPVSTQQFTEELDIPTFSDFIKSQKIQNEKKNSAEMVNKRSQASICEQVIGNENSKKKTPLKTKPFDDAYTHTSYSNYHFSPGQYYSKKDDSIGDDLCSMNCSPQNSAKTFIPSKGTDRLLQSQIQGNICRNKQNTFDSPVLLNDTVVTGTQGSKESMLENMDGYQELFSDSFSGEQDLSYLQNLKCADHTAASIPSSSQKENLPHKEEPLQRQTMVGSNVSSKWERFRHCEDSEEDFDAVSRSVNVLTPSTNAGNLCCGANKSKSSITMSKGENGISSNIAQYSDRGQVVKGPCSDRGQVVKAPSRFQSEWSDSEDDLDCSLFHSPDRFRSADKKNWTEEQCSVSTGKSENVSSSFNLLRKPTEILNETSNQNPETFSSENEAGTSLLYNRQPTSSHQNTLDAIFCRSSSNNDVGGLDHIFHSETIEMTPSQNISQQGTLRAVNLCSGVSHSQMKIGDGIDDLSCGQTIDQRRVITKFQTPVVGASSTNILPGSQV